VSDSILVGYATRYGSTQEVAEAITAALREHGLGVSIQLLRDVRSLKGYGAVVMGAPLFMFHWHQDALGFLSRHRKALEQMPVAVFALGPVHEPHDEEEWLASRAQLDAELVKVPWFKPATLEMFGGRYNPEKLGFPINVLAGKAPASDLRDWTAIRAWAGDLVAKLSPAISARSQSSGRRSA